MASCRRTSPDVLRKLRAALVFTLLASMAIPSSAPRIYSLAGAERQVERRILAAPADVAVFFRLLGGESEWSYQPDDTFHAASTMKVPVMIELFHQAHQGKLTLDDPLLIHNEFSLLSMARPSTLILVTMPPPTSTALRARPEPFANCAN